MSGADNSGGLSSGRQAVGMPSWSEFEPILRDRLWDHLTHEPAYLLQQDGGPVVDADLYLCRLLGFDDQIDADWTTTQAKSVLLRPLHRRPSLVVDPSPSLPAAEYVCQNVYAALAVDRSMCPDMPVRRWQDDFTATVALLLYRRRR